MRALLLALALGASAAAAERALWPDETPPAREEAERPGSVPGWLMWVYKHHISQVDAVRTCRFEPTCGSYAREAIRKHGPLLGWLMACERAIRYHGDTRTYRRILQDGHTRLSDPVSDNDFWLGRRDASPQRPQRQGTAMKQP